jgi:hypothetical protein
VVYPPRLGKGVEEDAVEEVFGVTVMGMEVTIIEPCALVVVKFAKDVADGAKLPVISLVLERSAEESGSCASDFEAKKAASAKGKSE